MTIAVAITDNDLKPRVWLMLSLNSLQWEAPLYNYMSGWDALQQPFLVLHTHRSKVFHAGHHNVMMNVTIAVAITDLPPFDFR